MKLRVGLVSAAHVHTPSYAHHFAAHSRSEVIGVWDDDPVRGFAFAADRGLRFVSSLDRLLDECDAVAISSENMKHAAQIVACAEAETHILCEKPVVPRREDFDVVRRAVSENDVKFMTAFPCRFSPAYQSLKKRIAAGEIGAIKAIMATNRGQCPQSWFVQPALSGGGAMIDHVVHVADLLRDLLGETPSQVQAKIGSNMYGGSDWDDSAMLTLNYPSGIFATLDSSWSRPASFRTWGDVTLKIVGESGSIHLDMFGQSLNLTAESFADHAYGSDLDGEMVDAFIRVCLDDEPIPVTLEDGLAAVEVSLKGYDSVRK
jgi:predicted dehydrogenase